MKRRRAPAPRADRPGEGAWLIDMGGRRCSTASARGGSISSATRNPRINAAIKAQLDTLEHAMLAGFTHEPVVGALRAPCRAHRAAPRPRLLRLGRRLGHRDRAQDRASTTGATAAQPGKTRFLEPGRRLSRRDGGRARGDRRGDLSRRLCPAGARRHTVPSPKRPPAGAGETAPTSPAAPRPRSRPSSPQHRAETAALIVEPLCAGRGRHGDVQPRIPAPGPPSCATATGYLVGRRDRRRLSAAAALSSPAQRRGHPPGPASACRRASRGGYLPLSMRADDRRGLRRLLRRHSRPRLPAFARVHRQPARLPGQRSPGLDIFAAGRSARPPTACAPACLGEAFCRRTSAPTRRFATCAQQGMILPPSTSPRHPPASPPLLR